MEAIVHLSREYGALSIAEFVESDTMFDKLREANVDYVQGYTVGKPMAIDTLLEQDQTLKRKVG